MAKNIELRDIPFGKREIVIDFMHEEDRRYESRLRALLVLNSNGASDNIDILEVIENPETIGTLKQPFDRSSLVSPSLIKHVISNVEFEEPHKIGDAQRLKVVRSILFQFDHQGYYRLLERPFGYVAKCYGQFIAELKIDSVTISEVLGMVHQ